MTRKDYTAGFTLVELLVTLAVAAILIGIAAPAFNDLIRQSRLTTSVNDFVLALTFARSEAVRRGVRVSVQAVAPVADDEWGGGFCVVVGTPGACPADELELRRFDALNNATFAGLDGTVTFDGRGRLVGSPGGTVELCSLDPDTIRGRRVRVGPTGAAVVEEHEQCNG